MSLTKLSMTGNNLIIPVRDSFVSDIPAEDGKIANLFFTVQTSNGNASKTKANESFDNRVFFAIEAKRTASTVS